MPRIIYQAMDMLIAICVYNIVVTRAPCTVYGKNNLCVKGRKMFGSCSMLWFMWNKSITHHFNNNNNQKKHILYVGWDLFSLRLYNNKWHLCGMNLIGKTRKRRRRKEDGGGGCETLSDILLKKRYHIKRLYAIPNVTMFLLSDSLKHSHCYIVTLFHLNEQASVCTYICIEINSIQICWDFE